MFLVPAERGQGLPQPQLGKWHRPAALTQKKHQHRPKGEATKQRAPEQPIVCASQRRKGLHEDVMLSQKGLSHNGANCSLWSRLPVAYVINIVFGKTLGHKSVEIRNWYDTLQDET